jgi:hypothetical protein
MGGRPPPPSFPPYTTPLVHPLEHRICLLWDPRSRTTSSSLGAVEGAAGPHAAGEPPALDGEGADAGAEGQGVDWLEVGERLVASVAAEEELQVAALAAAAGHAHRVERAGEVDAVAVAVDGELSEAPIADAPACEGCGCGRQRRGRVRGVRWVLGA